MERKLPVLNNQYLLELALTHRSYINEHPQVKEHNERLEFLGDAVLGFLIGEMLYKLYPQIDEAQLTHLRSRLVDEKQLGKLGAELGLGELMRLGKGAQKEGGRVNPSLLNDTFEAVIGAYYLDAGIDAVRSYVVSMFMPLATVYMGNNLLTQPTETFIDSKNRFQQWALSHHGEHPQYQIMAESGPDHAKQFTAQVSVKGIVYGTGCDRRKQEAEKRAAESALKELKLI